MRSWNPSNSTAIDSRLSFGVSALELPASFEIDDAKNFQENLEVFGADIVGIDMFMGGP